MRGKISRKRKAKKEGIVKIRQNESCYYCKEKVKEEEVDVFPQAIDYHRCHIDCFIEEEDWELREKALKELKN